VSLCFKVTGLFYETSGHKCRKFLDIRREGSRSSQPDLMVVMMNPGSSYPKDGIDNNSVPSDAHPDDTQHQIMKVLDAASLDYARILNLSDLRTPNSPSLYRFLKSEEASQIDHSIFSDSRTDELGELFVQGVPVIFGWGVNPCLVPLAKRAVEALNIDRPLGILKENTDFSYYHPLPRIHSKKIEWVEHVTGQLLT